MKKDQASFLAVVVALLGFSASAHAAQIVDIDSTPQLEDLVTHSVCDPQYEDGNKLIASHPEFESRIINSLKKLDWYFAENLLREAKRLHYCFTGPLYRITPRDVHSPVLPIPQKGVRQIGYRLDDMVYIDEALFNDPSISEYTRVYDLLHEVIHSYFPMCITDRDLKLRSMVKAISEVETGQIDSREELHSVMSANEVAFPLIVDDLDPYHEAIDFLLESPREQERDFTSLSQIDSELNIPFPILEELTCTERDFILARSPEQVLMDAYLSRLMDESTDGFRVIIYDQKYSSLDPISIVLNHIQSFSPAKQAVVFSGDFRMEIYQRYFNGIITASLARLADDRAALDHATANALGIPTGSSSPILDLGLPNRLPSEFGAFADLLIGFVRNGDWNSVTGLAGNGSPFSDVMNLTAIHQAIALFQFTYPLEGQFSDRRIDLFSQVLNQFLTSYLKSRLSDDDFTKLANLISVQKPFTTTN